MAHTQGHMSGPLRALIACIEFNESSHCMFLHSYGFTSYWSQLYNFDQVWIHMKLSDVKELQVIVTFGAKTDKTDL